MPRDLTPFLWLLKLGALLNAWLLAESFVTEGATTDPHVVLPARILFAVSAWRCLLPNRYKDNVVLHDSIGSSTFVTRALATGSELAFIYLLSYVVRLANIDRVVWVDAAAWMMMVAVTISQLLVWGAIATGRLRLYFYEEIGWGVIFVAHTAASAWLFVSDATPADLMPLVMAGLAFGLGYLPWQAIHLRALLVDARTDQPDGDALPLDRASVTQRLRRAITERRRDTSAEAWGGLVGLVWMAAYWATLIPVWAYAIMRVAGSRTV